MRILYIYIPTVVRGCVRGEGDEEGLSSEAANNGGLTHARTRE